MAPERFLFAVLVCLVMSAARPSMSTDMNTYIVHIDKTRIASFKQSLGKIKPWAEALLESVLQFSSSEEDQRSIKSTPILLYTYETALSGFAAKLTNEQAKSLQQIEGFLAAYPDELLSLHTTHTPQFLGLQPGRGLWSSANLAADVVVGVIDTGIWPEHESFSDANIAVVPQRWKGSCESGTKFSSSNCNKKIIGARAFWQGYEAVTGAINETKEYRSARDSQGHGTHTASTAAGNVVQNASLFGYAKGAAAGMRFSSRIAVYKACWASGCASSDILAAVDKAVADGVDVLSLSLGGISRPYYADNIAIAAFGAMQKGVFFSCSAGNSGPFTSTVSNTAPWIMTVAASYLDRSFPTIVKLSDGRSFKGASLYPGQQTKPLRIVYNTTAGKDPSARFCTNGTLSPELVKGKMVLCDRGVNGRTDKGEQVRRAGGSAMLLVNSEGQGEELYADAHVIPASSIGAKASSAVKNYTSLSSNPTATITFLGTVYGDPAPMMTAFSSRGPSLISPDIIKPDITAPGMSILAAWPPTVSPSLLESDPRRSMFNIISGTSMSCPHVSGLAALLKSVHPEWSPAAIKSALLTTAYTRTNQQTSIINVHTGSPATPFDYGSGHVDPERASNPGLIYNIAPDDYLDYLCSLKYTPAQVSVVARRNYTCSAGRKHRAGDLNYPSFSVLFSTKKIKKVVQTRTATHVWQSPCKYTVKVLEPEGVSVKVKPGVLAFGKTGQQLNYKVKFSSTNASDTSSFGELVWACGAFSVRSPIAVTWQ